MIAHKPDEGADRALLEARNLTKSYGSRTVLHDVSLRVHAGEGVALLGPNGSGKTTLLSLLAGVVRPDRGVVLLAGKPTARRIARRALALVPQDAAVYDGLSGDENVTLFGRLQGLGGATLRARVREALAAAALGDVARQRAGTYSGGMRRRLSLACALVHAPSLLLPDEPFEGVDDASRDHLLGVLTAAKRRGVALVLSTHRLQEAGALCDRYCSLRDGRVVTDQPVDAQDRQVVDQARACSAEGER